MSPHGLIRISSLRYLSPFIYFSTRTLCSVGVFDPRKIPSPAHFIVFTYGICKNSMLVNLHMGKGFKCPKHISICRDDTFKARVQNLLGLLGFSNTRNNSFFSKRFTTVRDSFEEPSQFPFLFSRHLSVSTSPVSFTEKKRGTHLPFRVSLEALEKPMRKTRQGVRPLEGEHPTRRMAPHKGSFQVSSEPTMRRTQHG